MKVKIFRPRKGVSFGDHPGSESLKGEKMEYLIQKATELGTKKDHSLLLLPFCSSLG